MQRHIHRDQHQSVNSTRAQRPRGRRRTLRGAAAVVAVALIVGAFIWHGAHQTAVDTTPSQPTIDSRWADAANSMRGNLQHAIDATHAGNTQGAADALTKVATTCRVAGGYTVGTGSAESAVRTGCAAVNFPIGAP